MNKEKPNCLINEKSPYLLQHAYNPVDWYPWSDEVFEKAQKENKPIFLSIGYSTCHWCHVMEKESFEDEQVAQLMNDTFVSVKVDREERPDIDNIYMNVCQLLTGSGGWPLTIILTPDKKPFFAGTYFPKESKYGRIGMLDLIKRIKELWQTKEVDIILSSDEIVNTIKHSTQIEAGNDITEEILHLAFKQFSERFDDEFGGFGDAPKFPTPHNLFFLLRYWKRTGSQSALDMVVKTLSEMRKGGIYDHVGFGFHRYSTDRKWLVPHFEKMLYDQAMMVIAYTEAYQATKNEEFKETACEILTYVERNLTSNEGGFYSAEDADSEGEEGKFYLWNVAEINEILKDDAGLIKNIFNLSPDGNFFDQTKENKTGENIFHRIKNFDELTGELNIPKDELKKKISESLEKLFTVREKRIHPFKDDKVLTDWNGLMIAAFAKAAQVFGETKFIELAERSVKFILKSLMTKEGSLLHRYRDGDAGITATLDDYAFFIWGLIELYETSFNSFYLSAAIELNKILIEHFFDEINGGFYFTSDEAEELITRTKDVNDGAIPSGNSVALYNLLRLARLTGNKEYEETALMTARTFSNNIKSNPYWHTQFLSAIDFMLSESSEVVIIGDMKSPDTKEMLNAIQEKFLPGKVILLKEGNEKDSELESLAPFTKGMNQLNDKPTAYVCKNFSCNLPLNEINKILELIK